MTILEIFDNTTILASGSTERGEIRGYLVKCRDQLTEAIKPAAPDPAAVMIAYALALVPSGRARRKLKLGDAPTPPLPPVNPPVISQSSAPTIPEVRLTLLASPGTRLLIEVLSTGAAATTLVQYKPAAEPSTTATVTATAEQRAAVELYEKSVIGELELLKSYVDMESDDDNPLPPSVATTIAALITRLNELAA
jgi:hypothetical protein